MEVEEERGRERTERKSVFFRCLVREKEGERRDFCVCERRTIPKTLLLI